MVASLYLHNIEARFHTVLRTTREAYYERYGVGSHVIGLHPRLGFATVDVTTSDTIPSLRRMASDGFIAIGIVAIAFTNKAQGLRSLRVYFASADESYAAEATIDEGRGWPLLGKWVDAAPLPCLSDIIKEAQS